MKPQLSLLMAAALVFTGCGGKETAKAPPADSATKAPAEKTSSGSPITAPVDYLGAVAKSKKTADTVIGGTSLDKVIDQFFAQEGRYPLTLDELVTEKYISAIPAPPYNTKLEYDPNKGKVKYTPLPPPAK